MLSLPVAPLAPRLKANDRVHRLQCKHLLACRIADRIDAWEHKRVGLEWLAGLATKFGVAVPPSLAESSPT